MATHLLRRVRDFAEVKHDGAISAEIAAQALDMLNVDAEGFDYIWIASCCWRLLINSSIGPVGLDNWRRRLKSDETIEGMCWSRI